MVVDIDHSLALSSSERFHEQMIGVDAETHN